MIAWNLYLSINYAFTLSDFIISCNSTEKNRLVNSTGHSLINYFSVFLIYLQHGVWPRRLRQMFEKIGSNFVCNFLQVPTGKFKQLISTKVIEQQILHSLFVKSSQTNLLEMVVATHTSSVCTYGHHTCTSFGFVKYTQRPSFKFLQNLKKWWGTFLIILIPLFDKNQKFCNV